MVNESLESHVCLPSLIEARKHSNYKVVDNKLSRNNICHVYFSSNGLYYPNTDEKVNECIQLDRFEWESLSPKGKSGPAKCIFIRDVYKQWYAKGINDSVNSVALLAQLITKLTIGYETRFIGTSSGGFAAVLFGKLCNCREIISISGQFSLERERGYKNPHIELLVKNNYIDISTFVLPEHVVYICPSRSKEDLDQYKRVKGNIVPIFIDSKEHGVPIFSFSITNFLKEDFGQIRKYCSVKKYNKTLFSLRYLSFDSLLKKLKRKLSSIHIFN